MNLQTQGGAALALLVLSACRTGEAAEDTPRLQTEDVTRGDLTILAEGLGARDPRTALEEDVEHPVREEAPMGKQPTLSKVGKKSAEKKL